MKTNCPVIYPGHDKIQTVSNKYKIIEKPSWKKPTLLKVAKINNRNKGRIG